MKKILLGLWLCCLASITGQAQRLRHFDPASLVRSYQLDITWHKTTLLIFPTSIQSADRGDKYVLAQKVKGTDNILKVKAGQKDFKQSNLSVITKDGRVYSFTVNYSDDPPYQVVDLRKSRVKAKAKFSGLSLNKKQIENYLMLITRQKIFMHGVKQHKYQMKFKLRSIYVRGDVLFFRFSLNNKTQLNYNIDFLRFYIKNKKQPKRTAIQEREIHPVLLKVLPDKTPDAETTIVAAFKKFSIADDKDFIIELMEKGGDRNFRLKVPQRKLLNSRTLPRLPQN
jgi:conjugative transposon TraN protein